MVAAPAKDGGVFLFALHQHAYHRGKFLDLSWLTSNLFEDLLAYADGLELTVHRAAAGFDVDSLSNISTVIAKSAVWFSGVLKSFHIGKILLFPFRAFDFQIETISACQVFRGPPAQ